MQLTVMRFRVSQRKPAGWQSSTLSTLRMDGQGVTVAGQFGRRQWWGSVDRRRQRPARRFGAGTLDASVVNAWAHAALSHGTRQRGVGAGRRELEQNGHLDDMAAAGSPLALSSGDHS